MPNSAPHRCLALASKIRTQARFADELEMTAALGGRRLLLQRLGEFTVRRRVLLQIGGDEASTAAQPSLLRR